MRRTKKSQRCVWGAKKMCARNALHAILFTRLHSLLGGDGDNQHVFSLSSERQSAMQRLDTKRLVWSEITTRARERISWLWPWRRLCESCLQRSSLSLSVGGGGAAAKYTAHLHTARTHSAILLVAENVIIYPPRAAPSSSLHCAARGARPILNPPSRVAALRISEFHHSLRLMIGVRRDVNVNIALLYNL
jgi:hypothetical protein